MCGLTGFYISKSSPNSSHKLQSITKYFSSQDYQNQSSLYFRGPDEQLIVCNENLVVNFRRLTIFSYKKLTSPYLSSCGRYSTLMNGEIYSVKEKAFELNLSLDMLECDSQILAETYSCQGPTGFANLHGMFAGYIYDNIDKSVVLVRDHFGQKPLYYYYKDDILLFSSHLNDILLLMSQLNLSNTPSNDYWFSRSVFPWLSFPNSPYREINQLPAGSFLRVSNSSYEINKYYDIASVVSQQIESTGTVSFPDLADIVRSDCALVFNHGKEPKSLIISGGWDSSSIPFVLQQQNINISSSQLFCLNLPGRLSSQIVHKLADFLPVSLDFLQLKNHDEAIRTQYLDNYHDIFDHSIPYSHYLFDAISSSYKVAIGGDGPDELLLGYDIPAKFSDSSISSDVKLKLLTYFIERHSLYKYSQAPISEVICELEKFSSSNQFPSFTSFMTDINTLSSLFPFSTALKILLLNYYLPLILAKVDTSSMHNSVEARTPYLSPHFVSSCLTNTTINAKPSLFKHLLPKNIYQLLYDIPKEGFSPSSSYKQSQFHDIQASTAGYCLTDLPCFARFPIFEAFYSSTLDRMPGLQRLNSLFI